MTVIRCQASMLVLGILPFFVKACDCFGGSDGV